MATNNTSINAENKMEDIICSNFNELNKESQKLLVTSYTDDKSRGWFDKILGQKSNNVYFFSNMPLPIPSRNYHNACRIICGY